MLDELLQKIGLKYEDLNSIEKETLGSWMQALNKSELSIPKIKDFIGAMRDSVEQELTRIDHNSKQDIFLKARLRNYMLLEAFLTSPEKAKEQIERAIAGMAPKVR